MEGKTPHYAINIHLFNCGAAKGAELEKPG